MRLVWDADAELYEPAPTDYNARQSLAMLASLYRLDGLLPLEATDDGACDDCRHEGHRYVYGRVHVCLACGLKRRKAMEAAA